MKYLIVSDSSSNFFEMPGDIPYKTVPLKILIDDQEYPDVRGLDIAMLVDRMEHSSKNSSSCPNTSEWIEAFRGFDTIFCITISSSLSGSYSSAVQAQQQYMEENPGTNVYVIDSLSTGGEMHLIAEKLVELMDRQLSFEEIRDQIEAYRQSTHLLFCLESMANLAKNGRVNPAIAAIAGLLGIRFIGFASPEGTIHQAAVARGEKKTMSALIGELLKHGYEGGKVWISHCLNAETAEKLRSRIIEQFPKAADLIMIEPMTGLCSYYAERGGMIIGFETDGLH